MWASVNGGVHWKRGYTTMEMKCQIVGPCRRPYENILANAETFPNITCTIHIGGLTRRVGVSEVWQRKQEQWC